jgi:holo-[acyl-carrier protein] synthase
VVIGIGIDIVDLDEFRERLTDELVREVFLPGEIEYASSQARPWEQYAARFAAKEAVFKALGEGLGQGLTWKDVEVLRAPTGKISLRLAGRALGMAEGRGLTALRLSIAHSKKSAVAVVIVEGAAQPLGQGGSR